MARISSVAQLRQTLAEPRATTKAKILDALDAQAKAFIAASSYALLATANADGKLEVSPKGDVAGFVKVETDRSLLIPDRPGNNLAFGLENIIATGAVGLIFLRPGTAETLRIAGRADIFDDADLLAQLGTPERPALLAIRVEVERCYFHCGRSAHRSGIWKPESWPERQTISFGNVIAPRVGGDDRLAGDIDAMVEGAYTARLWKNT